MIKYPPIVYLTATAHYMRRANDAFYKFYINEETKDERILELSRALNELALLFSSVINEYKDKYEDDDINL